MFKKKITTSLVLFTGLFNVVYSFEAACHNALKNPPNCSGDRPPHNPSQLRPTGICTEPNEDAGGAQFNGVVFQTSVRQTTEEDAVNVLLIKERLDELVKKIQLTNHRVVQQESDEEEGLLEEHVLGHDFDKIDLSNRNLKKILQGYEAFIEGNVEHKVKLEKNTKKGFCCHPKTCSIF